MTGKGMGGGEGELGLVDRQYCHSLPTPHLLLAIIELITSF